MEYARNQPMLGIHAYSNVFHRPAVIDHIFLQSYMLHMYKLLSRQFHERPCCPTRLRTRSCNRASGCPKPARPGLRTCAPRPPRRPRILSSIASRVLAQPVCASAAERNWSAYGVIKASARRSVAGGGRRGGWTCRVQQDKADYFYSAPRRRLLSSPRRCVG